MKKAHCITASLALAILLSVTPHTFAKGGSFSGGGARSFSSPSPSRSFSMPSTPRPAAPPASAQRPPAPSYDSAARTATAHAESQRHWEASQKVQTPPSGAHNGQQSGAPAPSRTYAPAMNAPTTPKYTQERYATREERSQTVFGSTSVQSGYSPTVVHNDSFSNVFFWMWLMDHNRSSEKERDEWAYHHRDSMDPARFEELKKSDAGLESRLKALEESGVKKDPSYVPPSLKGNEDLMYKDEAVKQHVTSGPGLGTFLWIILLASLLCFALWFLFWPRYERSAS